MKLLSGNPIKYAFMCLFYITIFLCAAGSCGHDCEDQQEVTTTLHRAHHARRKAESVAAHLLARLDRSSGGIGGSGHSHTGDGLGGGGGGGSAGNPWEDVSTNSRTAR